MNHQLTPEVTFESPFSSLGKQCLRVGMAVLLIAALALVGLLLGHYSDVFSPAKLKRIVTDLGAGGPIIYMAVLALSVVVSPIPGAPLVVMGGVIWGWPLAGLFSISGGFLGSLVAYGIARTLGLATVQLLTGRSIAIAPDYENQYVGWMVFLSRLLPVLPFGFISYGWGLANISVRRYAIATLLGMAPPTLLLSYAGEAFTTTFTAATVSLILILLLIVGVPLLMQRDRFDLTGIIQVETDRQS